MDVNALAFDGAGPCLCADVGALTDEAMALSGAVAGNTSDFTYSHVGDLPARLAFNMDGTWSFDSGVLFDSLHTGESHLVSFNYRASKSSFAQWAQHFVNVSHTRNADLSRTSNTGF